MKIQSFDLIFYKGNSWLDKIIKKKLNSRYSHVGLVLDNFHTVETAWNIPLKIRHFSYRLGDFDRYRIPNLTDEQKERMTLFIQKTLNSKYDFIEILRYFGFGFKDDKNRYICISWIDECLKFSGVDVKCDIEVKKFEDLILKYGLVRINEQ
ncbi:MAG: hypothetical protein PWQ70_2698 [Clostridiales bacterium]|nr:hypothetical protein [Clostridiales bacterium]